MLVPYEYRHSSATRAYVFSTLSSSRSKCTCSWFSLYFEPGELDNKTKLTNYRMWFEAVLTRFDLEWHDVVFRLHNIRYNKQDRRTLMQNMRYRSDHKKKNSQNRIIYWIWKYAVIFMGFWSSQGVCVHPIFRFWLVPLPLPRVLEEHKTLVVTNKLLIDGEMDMCSNSTQSIDIKTTSDDSSLPSLGSNRHNWLNQI